jgi:hypothetical protein
MRLTKQVGKEMLFEAAVLAAGCAEMALCHKSNLLLAALLIALVAVELAFWRGGRTVAFLVTGAIVGPSTEAIAVWGGAWQYANPTLLGIPLWLPFGWAYGTVLIVGIVDTIGKMTQAPGRDSVPIAPK